MANPIIIYKTLYHNIISAITTQTLYTSPSGTPDIHSIIAGIKIQNTSSSSSVTVKFWITPTSGTAEADAYIFEDTITLGPKEKAMLVGPETITEGETIKVQVSVANIVNIRIKGSTVQA